jgi:large-conductance mechanosensitive channel
MVDLGILKGLERFFVNTEMMGLAVAVVFGKVFLRVIESFINCLLYPLFSGGNIGFGIFTSRSIDFVVTVVITYLVFIRPFQKKIKENDKEIKKEDQESLALAISKAIKQSKGTVIWDQV